MLKTLKQIGLCALFLAIVIATVYPVNWVFARIGLGDDSNLSPRAIGIYGASALIEVVIAGGVLALIERRSIFAYGFGLVASAPKRFGEGAALGIACAAFVAACMLAFGGMQVRGFALRGGDVILYAGAWSAAILVAALAEEALVRGFLLVTLSRGIGLLAASIVTSLIFAYGHMSKPGENAFDFVSLALLGLLACYTYGMTGSLWLALGFHWGFDVMQLFVIGSPNGTQNPVGALLDATFRGASWINGGQLGTEASWFMVPAIAAAFIYIAVRSRGSASGTVEEPMRG